jgi:hypothetical protein
MSDEGGARYHFGPLERRGLVAGWRGGQLAVVSAGLVAAVCVLRGRSGLAGVAGALVCVAVAVALSTWPLSGRTAEQWAPDALRHAGTWVRRRRHAGGSPFASLEVTSVDSGGNRATAVVHDAALRTYTAVLPAWGQGFVLRSPDDKGAQVAAWSNVLAALARQGSAVHRLQWVARCVPDDGAGLRRHFERHGVLGPGAPAQRSYAALLQAETAAARRHEVWLAVTVDSTRAARAVRSAGGGRGGACTVVLRETAWLRRQLADAGIDSGAALDPPALAACVRGQFDGEGALEVPPHPVWPWPMAVHAEWGRARVDGSWVATYWMAEWPRRQVGPEFLGPLLLADVRRTVALVMEPLSATEATRHVEKARTADIADAELRRRGGFLATARRRREEEVLVEREAELAEGHAHYRFSGYVTVTAPQPEELEDACVRTEQAAGRCGVELRRCYGDQARALTCTLPLGRGLS